MKEFGLTIRCSTAEELARALRAALAMVETMPGLVDGLAVDGIILIGTDAEVQRAE